MSNLLQAIKKISNSLTVVYDHKIGKTVIVPASDKINKQDALDAIQHIINAYQVTDVDLMGLDVAKTKTLNSYTENY